MKSLSRAALASAAILVIGAGAASTAQPQPQPQSRVAPAVEVQMQHLQRSAAQARAYFDRNAQARAKLVEAVTSRNQAEARRLLAAAGFSAEDLAESRLTLNDRTAVRGRARGGGQMGELKKVVILINCCPPEIIIEIEF